jgi:hypothetical protein
MPSEHDYTLITRRHPKRGILFDIPRYLGEKKRTLDFLVELFGDKARTPFLFVQVKATRMGYSERDGRLRVTVTREEMRRLAAYPAPTYVVGIDESGERGYVVCAQGEQATGFTRMCTDYPLTPDGLELLWEDVARFWSLNDRTLFSSSLLDPRWR